MKSNVSKTSCTSSVYGFIRLVHWRNNPYKKTLIYIYLMPHITVIWVYTNGIAKQHNKLLINILLFLLLLVLLIYLGMCPSVLTHIHPYMSKLRLLLKTDDETNGLIFTMGPVHARNHGLGCSVAGVRNWPQGVQVVGLIVCPFRNITGGRDPALPLEYLEALR